MLQWLVRGAKNRVLIKLGVEDRTPAATVAPQRGIVHLHEER